jgi:hypothetical protein
MCTHLRHSGESLKNYVAHLWVEVGQLGVKDYGRLGLSPCSLKGRHQRTAGTRFFSLMPRRKQNVPPEQTYYTMGRQPTARRLRGALQVVLRGLRLHL